MKLLFLWITCLVLLTGCWSNLELDNTALVHGVGLEKAENGQLSLTFEIIKPGGTGDDSGTSGDSQMQGEHIVLEEVTDSPLDGAREVIKYTKRRLDFGHAETWIIGEKLAKDDFVRPLDVVRRDQMLRLNSHIFITKNHPTDVLNTSTLYENLVASELAASMDQTQFVAEYAPITLREFYRDIEGPIGNGYIPMISLDNVNDNHVTKIEGTAVIQKHRMVGELDRIETAGLNILLNHVKGGSIRSYLTEDELVSIEITKLKTKTTPTLKDNQLNVKVDVKIKGTIADNLSIDREINEDFFRDVESAVSKHTEQTIRLTLNKLQHELKTDITDIGVKTYRKYPSEWQQISKNWNDMFANANISIDIDTNIVHQGLIEQNIRESDDPHNNPYFFWRKKEG